MSDPHLRVDLQHRVGSFALEVFFQLAAPWTVLFGASGSGKTTILRAIQGLLAPNAGRIALARQVLLDTEYRIAIPSHLRSIRSAAQSAHLFPNKTVRQNLLWGAASPPQAAGHAAAQALQLFRIEPLAEKRPNTLSGGERQRVHVARAVVSAVTAPGTFLLLDEPFNGLDHALRDTLAIELRDWLRSQGVPVLSVTHDIGEAFLLDAEVLRLEAGRIAAQGPPSEVLAPERNRLLQQLAAATSPAAPAPVPA